MSQDDSHITWRKSKEDITVDYNAWNRQIVKEYNLPNGRPKKAFINKSNDYVVGMVLTPEDNNIILCREYRPGPEKIMLDMPTGAINKDEDPFEAMRRELLEETGYVGDIELVNITAVGPYSIQRRHTFLVRNSRKVSKQLLDHDEFIEVVEMPLAKFLNHYVLPGYTTNSTATFFCLDYLGLMKISV